MNVLTTGKKITKGSQMWTWKILQKDERKKKVHYYWKELLSNNSFSAFAKIMEPCNSQNTNGKNFFMLYYGSGKNQKALEYLMNSFFYYFNGRYHLHVSTIIEDWREGKYSKIRTNKWSIQIFLSLYKT